MFFKRTLPAEPLISFVKEYWIVEDDDSTPALQKIIPDGFCEMIFHYGDPYRINLHGGWETQSNMLFAGQISNHFYLENTGRSGILGIKLRPAAFYSLSGWNMAMLTNKVVALATLFPAPLTEEAGELTTEGMSPDERIQAAEAWLLDVLRAQTPRDTTKVQEALDIIFDQNGMTDIESLAQKVNCTRRHLERTFKERVGLTPKLFSRIVRFNYIFQVMKEGDASWISIALDSGHFDQAHFIKNFKAFTGEEPSRYGFDEMNMANFFLKK